MHVMPLSIYFDNCKRLSVTQGEQREFMVMLYDEQKNAPVDLTGLSVAFAFPSTSGMSIKRTSGGTVVDLTKSKLGDMQTIFYAPHGFITGDVVTIPADADNYTTPLAPGGQYIVTVIDSVTFTLADAATGANIVLDANSGSVRLLEMMSIVLGVAILGKLSLWLTSDVTAQMAAMQGQDYQMTLQGNGYTRIYTGRGQLDVFAQAAP